jgi:hypothetical protein
VVHQSVKGDCTDDGDALKYLAEVEAEIEAEQAEVIA